MGNVNYIEDVKDRPPVLGTTENEARLGKKMGQKQEDKKRKKQKRKEQKIESQKYTEVKKNRTEMIKNDSERERQGEYKMERKERFLNMSENGKKSAKKLVMKWLARGHDQKKKHKIHKRGWEKSVGKAEGKKTKGRDERRSRLQVGCEPY